MCIRDSYKDRQTVTISTRSYYWITRCCRQHNSNWHKKTAERGLAFFLWLLAMVRWSLAICELWALPVLGNGLQAPILHRRYAASCVVLPSAAAGFWEAVGFVRGVFIIKKLKKVSCEYNWLNGWNSTLQAAWYIRHVCWTCSFYISLIVWCLWTKYTIWLLILSFK